MSEKTITRSRGYRLKGHSVEEYFVESDNYLNEIGLCISCLQMGGASFENIQKEIAIKFPNHTFIWKDEVNQ